MNIRDAIMIAESLGYEILSNEKEESFSVIEARKRMLSKLSRSHGACPVECHW